MDISPEVVSGFAGALLALLFDYVPGLNTWYGDLLPEHKRLIMLGLLVAVAGGIFALGCGGYIGDALVCSDKGALKLLWTVLTAIGINQTTHLIGKKPAGG